MPSDAAAASDGPRLLGAEQKVALGAFDEHAAQLEFAHRPGEFARAFIAREGVDGREPVELAGILADELGHLIVDPLLGAGRHFAVGVLDEGGRRVDHARRDPALSTEPSSACGLCRLPLIFSQAGRAAGGMLAILVSVQDGPI